MKFIDKNEEPEIFTNWKALENEDWKPTWDNFQKPEKEAVHNSLLKEQGYIFSYCGMRIKIKNSHIEHFKPRGKYQNLILDYTNFLASCQGEGEGSSPIHCGHKKDDEKKSYDDNLMVSPLKENCGDFFRYTEDGQILATEELDKQNAAETTIDRLGLNIDKLKAMRQGAIEAILEDFELLNAEEKQQLIDGLDQTNASGEYEEFVAAIVYVIQQYL